MNIVTNKLKTLIESHFHKYLSKDNYKVYEKDSRSLLTNNRLDISFKLFYLKYKSKNPKLAEEIYKRHIEAFTLGKFIEPGNKDKSSFSKYLDEFHKIYKEINLKGFEVSKSIVPLSKNGSIADGSHRVASSIFLKKNVYCLPIDSEIPSYDYTFFKSRNISEQTLDKVTRSYIEFSDNIYCAIIWPSANGKINEIEKILNKIVYKKKIKLNPNGAHNLISQIYHNENWIGSSSSNFKGAEGKLVECFKNFNPFNIYFFNCDSLNKVREIKNDIRALFNIGKHSIHISDTKQEADRISKVLLNQNGIHFLNYAKPNKYKSTNEEIERIKNRYTDKDLVIGGDFLLSLYGIKENSEIDVIENNSLRGSKYFNIEVKELLFNSEYYFVYNGLKFLSFNKLFDLKKEKKISKIENSIDLMRPYISERSFIKSRFNFNNYTAYNKIKIKIIFIKILKLLKLHSFVKKIINYLIKK